tara:strand:- start:239 stop:1147 length:909 start_codon:yes stop_codon:yes gene_type:complete
MSLPLGRVSEGAKAFDDKIKQATASFASNQYVSGTKEFLASNSLVAKFAFLLLVLFAFVAILRVGASALGWLLGPSDNPRLIKGMIDAKQMVTIPQDPKLKGSIPVLRSRDQRDGIEFTWSVWMYINDLVYKEGQYRHVFHKGNDNINFGGSKIGMNFPNNGPGLYLGPKENTLVVVMNTFDTIGEEIEIENIPVKKWVNVILQCDGKNLDVYVNGTLARRHILSGVPKQNYGDVYVAMNGGFDGYISELQYFNSDIGLARINAIVSGGPNLKMTDTNLTESAPHYLSTRWYYSGFKDGYNP